MILCVSQFKHGNVKNLLLKAKSGSGNFNRMPRWNSPWEIHLRWHSTGQAPVKFAALVFFWKNLLDL